MFRQLILAKTMEATWASRRLLRESLLGRMLVLALRAPDRASARGLQAAIQACHRAAANEPGGARGRSTESGRCAEEIPHHCSTHGRLGDIVLGRQVCEEMIR